MPSFKIPTDFATETAYAIGDQVNFNGVNYEAIVVIADTNTITPVDDDGDSWNVVGVIEIQDVYGLYHSIRLTLNSDAPEVNNSIWMFIQQADFNLGKRLRTIGQRNMRTVTLDDDSKADISELGILDIDHIKIAGDGNLASSLRQRGKVQVLAADGKKEIEELNQYFRQDYLFSNTSTFNYPLYYIDGRNLIIAPDFDEGTEVEITFKEAEPKLGTTQLSVNDDYEPINSDGETLAEWVANGNDAEDFVQAEIFIDFNGWIEQCPHLLKLDALVAAEMFLDNDPRVAAWRQEYALNLKETIDYFYRFESDRPNTVRQSSPYTF